MDKADRTLWQAWRERRDQDAFATLVQPHLRFAFDFARRMGCTAADADDVVQQSLASLAREKTARPVEVGLRSWLGRAVSLQTKMHFRSSARRRRREEAYERPPPTATALEDRDEIEAALADLPQAQREAVALRYLHDMEYSEMAHVLGVSPNACRIRVHRALEQMRARLGRAPAALVASLPLLAGEAGAAVVPRALHATAAAALGLKALLVAAALLVAVGVATLARMGDPAPTRNADTRPETVALQDGEEVPQTPAPQPRDEPAPPPERARAAFQAIFDAGGTVGFRVGERVRWYEGPDRLPTGRPLGLRFRGGEVARQAEAARPFGHWESVTFENGKGALDDAGWIGSLRALRSLALERIEIDADVLRALGRLPHLAWISLNYSTFDAGALRELEGKDSLTTLRVRETSVRDEHLPVIGTLVNLEFLDLSGLPITDDALLHLSSLRPVKLDLRKSLLTGSGLEHMDLSRLEELDAEDARATDALLQALRRSTRLKELCLNRSSVTDTGLRHLRACVALEQIELDETPGITGQVDGLITLADLPRLRRLMLEGSMVADAAVPQLLRLRQLERLDVEGTRISKEALDRLADGLPGCKVK